MHDWKRHRHGFEDGDFYGRTYRLLIPARVHGGYGCLVRSGEGIVVRGEVGSRIHGITVTKVEVELRGG